MRNLRRLGALALLLTATACAGARPSAAPRGPGAASSSPTEFRELFPTWTAVPRFHRLSDGSVVVSVGQALGSLEETGIVWHPEWSRGMPPGDVDASGTEEIATIRGGFGPGQRAYVTTTSEPVTSGAGASRARWVRTADGRWTQGAAEAGFDAPPDRSDLFPWETKAFVPTADSATRIAVVAHYLLQESDGMLVPGEQATVEPCKAAPAFYKVVGPAPTINGASLAALPPLPNDGCLVDYRAWKSSPALPLPDRVLMVVREAGGRLRIERFEGGKTKVIRPDHGAAARSKYVVQWPEVTIHGWDDLELRGAFVGSSDDAREASFPVELRWDGAAFRPAPTLRGPAGATGIDASEITERLEGRLIGGPVSCAKGPTSSQAASTPTVRSRRRRGSLGASSSVRGPEESSMKSRFPSLVCPRTPGPS